MQRENELSSRDRRGCDRRRRSRFVWREQRTGFDRRFPEGSGRVISLERALVGLRDRPAQLRVLLLTVNLLNVADFWLTLNVLNNGGGEANPIMRSLFELGPVWAGLFKVAAIMLVSLLLWRCRSYRMVLAAALSMFAMFAAVLFYHLFGLATFG